LPSAPTFGCVVDSDTITNEQQAQVRRYGLWVTIGMMVLCNAIFLGGMWLTGIRLEQLIRIPDIFNPLQDICLRFTWHQVEGDDQPVRLCSEWILLSDPSGETHTLQKETEVVKGGDGRLYFDYGAQVDYRVFLFGAFVIAIIIFGIWLKRYLIRRYRMHLQQHTSSLV
jgi:hypothetical protein